MNALKLKEENRVYINVSFWVFFRRLSTDSRRFGTLYRFRLHKQVDEVLNRPAYEDGTDGEFRNVGYQYSEAGKTPKNNILHIKHGESLKSRMYILT
jgi:hypothetical protein